MGYTVTVPNLIIEVASEPSPNNITLTTVAADQNMNSITIPSDLQGKIYHAYLDVIFPLAKEESGGVNKLNGAQYIKIYKVWPTTYNAIYLCDNALMLPASYEGAYGRVYGTIDIASYINAGDTIQVYWENMVCDADVMRFYGNQPILRVMLG